MKRVLVAALVVFFLVPVFAFCQEKTKESGTSIRMDEMAMEQGEAQEHSRKDKKFDKHGKMAMMGMMMKKEMVASSDGGVIVLSGNKLLKYDKNLKLVKEVEIKSECNEMMKDKHKKHGEKAEGKEEESGAEKQAH
jgi:hypothetical protein